MSMPRPSRVEVLYALQSIPYSRIRGRSSREIRVFSRCGEAEPLIDILCNRHGQSTAPRTNQWQQRKWGNLTSHLTKIVIGMLGLT